MLKKKLVLVTMVALMVLPIMTFAVVTATSDTAAPVVGVAVADLGTGEDPGGVTVNSPPLPPPGGPGHTGD
jgi:hypothetical protein